MVRNERKDKPRRMPEELQLQNSGSPERVQLPSLQALRRQTHPTSDAERGPGCFSGCDPCDRFVAGALKLKMGKTETSKLLSLVLRHRPQDIGITLDEQGWVAVDALLEALARNGTTLSRAALHELVSDNDKKRFTLSSDGERIRAAQGHSVKVALGLEPQTPPDRLYHGTATRNLVSIRAEGLLAGQRHQVHLSADIGTARSVGQRYGTPHVLRVDCIAMVAAGHRFYRADNGVWLTDHVPARFLDDAE